MKISIITSVYNNQETIKEAIESVLSQTYKNIEYIIIDGGSDDGTVDIIKEYKNDIDIFVSEQDKGIYDGLNKGISLATGDIIGFLHSDDLYESENILKIVADNFLDNSKLDGVYGDLVYTSKEDTSKVLRYWKSKTFDKRLLSKGWMPAHPTLFLKKSIYNTYGNFDLDFKIAADYDFMLRILSKDINVRYIPQVLYKMRVGGESNKSIKNLFIKSKEDLYAMRKNNISGFYGLIYKNLSKIPQFFLKDKSFKTLYI